ncbi:MAG: hydantoinase B/oxoprolinase family protein [Rubrivivax sp.]
MGEVVLVCNAGFEDVLTLGRQHREDPWALHPQPSPWPAWLPEEDRWGVSARLDARGAEVLPFGAEDLASLARRLAARPVAPRAVAVCLLHALRAPRHEQAVARALQQACPGVHVVCSHSLPQAPATEFERTVATLRAAWGECAPFGAEAMTGAAACPGLGTPPAGDPFARDMEALCDAMQAALSRYAVSSISAEAMDCVAAVFLPDGRLLAQARSLPLLLGSLGPAVRGVLAAFEVSAMREGDVFLANDPWSGGTHLPDLTLVRPVCADGAVRALVGCMLHHQDVGGLTPGSVPTDATCIQHEGLRIPPVQAWRAGVADEPLLRLVCANSRTPEALRGDLWAQFQALASGEAAEQAWLGARGCQAFTQAAVRALAASTAATRDALAAVADGQWTVEDALDGDGLTDEPVQVAVTLRKQGDRVQVDLRGCADQTRGPVNASRAATWAAVSHFARLLAPHAPANDGCLEPVELLTRPGSIVDPAWPAALNARTNLVKLLANALAAAWAQADPARAAAAHAGVAAVLSFSGTREDGSAWVSTEIVASAAGATPWGPGADAVATDVGNARNTPAEVLEARTPVRLERLAVRRGSGGSGTHRGGHGMVRAWRLLDGAGLVSYRGERHRTAAPGAAGGYPGTCGSARLERRDGRIEHLPAKACVAWQAGDLFVIETAGAGGWGPHVPVEPAPGSAT